MDYPPTPTKSKATGHLSTPISAVTTTGSRIPGLPLTCASAGKSSASNGG